MDTFFAGLPLTDVHQALARNIKSIRVSQNLFDDLSDDPADWHATENHEIATKPHSYVSQAPSIDRPFEEAEWFNAIEYPFKNWMASRFCDGNFGAEPPMRLQMRLYTVQAQHVEQVAVVLRTQVGQAEQFGEVGCASQDDAPTAGLVWRSGRHPLCILVTKFTTAIVILLVCFSDLKIDGFASSVWMVAAWLPVAWVDQGVSRSRCLQGLLRVESGLNKK